MTRDTVPRTGVCVRGVSIAAHSLPTNANLSCAEVLDREIRRHLTQSLQGPDDVVGVRGGGLGGRDRFVQRMR